MNGALFGIKRNPEERPIQKIWSDLIAGQFQLIGDRILENR
jgi:hypothetical protein